MAYQIPFAPVAPAGELPDLLTAHEAAGLLRIPRSSLYASTKRGTVPQPIRFTERRMRWRKSDILAFIAGTWKPEQVEA